MGIFDILVHNSATRSRTLLPTEVVVYPQGFRGKLDHDLSLCVGCGACRYVCSPGAIRFDSGQPSAITWEYLASQCTYCGRCVDFCPTHALAFERQSPQVGLDARTAEKDEHAVTYQPCERCGKPIIPLPEHIADRFFTEQARRGEPDPRHLCEQCRARETAGRFKNNLLQY